MFAIVPWPGGAVTVGVVREGMGKKLFNSCLSCWTCVPTSWVLFSCPICLEKTVLVFHLPEFLTNSFLPHTCLSLHVPLFHFYIQENNLFGDSWCAWSSESSLLSSTGFSVPEEFSFPSSSHQPEDFFWELPSWYCHSPFATLKEVFPHNTHLLFCSFSGCKRSIFKLSTTVRTDILLSGNCWTRNWKTSSNADEKADCHYGSKSSHQGHKQ